MNLLCAILAGCLILSCPAIYGYKILIPFLVVPPEDQILYKSMATLLADAGHSVYLLSGHSEPMTHNNVTDINIDMSSIFDQLPARDGYSLHFYMQAIKHAAQALWTDLRATDLYESRHALHAVILPVAYHEFCLPFIKDTNAALITFSPKGVDYVNMGYFSGNWMSVAVTPVLTGTILNHKSLVDRALNLYFLVANIFYRKIAYDPMVNYIINKYTPDVGDVYKLFPRNVLTLVNCHRSICHSHPLLPSQVEVGGFHVLPWHAASSQETKRVDELVRKSVNDVIYVDCADVAHGGYYSVGIKLLLLDVFRQLRETVVWTCYCADMEAIMPGNVIVAPPSMGHQWILGHPRTVLFVSDCDSNAVKEALHYGVPLLAVPATAAQLTEARTLYARNLTVANSEEGYSRENLLLNIKKMLHKTYRQRAAEASELFKQRLVSPQRLLVTSVEKAVELKHVAYPAYPAVSRSIFTNLGFDNFLHLITIGLVFMWGVSKLWSIPVRLINITAQCLVYLCEGKINVINISKKIEPNDKKGGGIEIAPRRVNLLEFSIQIVKKKWPVRKTCIKKRVYGKETVDQNCVNSVYGKETVNQNCISESNVQQEGQ